MLLEVLDLLKSWCLSSVGCLGVRGRCSVGSRDQCQHDQEHRHGTYGSSSGLASTGNQLWTQNKPGIADRAEPGDSFGAAIGIGDLNGDGRDDLAVGVPEEGIGAADGDGAVNAIYGSSGGLTATGNQLWSQNSSGVREAAEAGDSFGTALGAGDLNGDGSGDLAIGVSSESINAAAGAGAVNVIYGSGSGLGSAGNQLWTQNSPGVRDAAETGDSLGTALASGDLNANGADLSAPSRQHDARRCGRRGQLHAGAEAKPPANAKP